MHFKKQEQVQVPLFFVVVEKSTTTIVVIFGPFVANLSHFFPEPQLIYWRYC